MQPKILLYFLLISLVNFQSADFQNEICSVTEEGSNEIKPCLFPFQYQDQTFDECTILNDPEHKPWCSTKVDEEGYHVPSGGYWGHCSQECVKYKAEVQPAEKAFQKGFTKLLVGVGETASGKTNSIEVIDLESSSTTCKDLPNFPVAVSGSIGGLGFQDKPIICAGDDRSSVVNKCFTLENNEWISSASMNSERFLAAVSPSPYQNKSQKFLVTGGYDGQRQNTAEVLTEQGWESFLPSLPVTIYNHCNVLVNSTTLMVISGYQDGYRSSNTFYFNTDNEVWVKGPQLKTQRAGQSCGRIRKESQSQEFSIIVAGGWNGTSYTSSVEILDERATEWRKGPELPFGIAWSQMVEDQNGVVVLVGGEPGYLDTLYQLPHGGADAEWTKMEQKLKIGRRYHSAFLVPDEIVDCS